MNIFKNIYRSLIHLLSYRTTSKRKTKKVQKQKQNQDTQKYPTQPYVSRPHAHASTDSLEWAFLDELQASTRSKGSFCVTFRADRVLDMRLHLKMLQIRVQSAGLHLNRDINGCFFFFVHTYNIDTGSCFIKFYF